MRYVYALAWIAFLTIIGVASADNQSLGNFPSVTIGDPAAQVSPLGNVVVSKDHKGDLSSEAQESLMLISNYSELTGRMVKVWVTFAMPFEADSSLRTSEVVELEAQWRQLYIQEVIQPLVADGHAVLLETPDYLAEAPGALVRVSSDGVESLASSEVIRHIRTMK